MKTQSDELSSLILSVVALIPYGKVASYGQIAKMAGLPRHARMVGTVLKKMDKDAVIPWHRVINGQGKISVMHENSQGENIQQVLLMQEGVVVLNGKINLKKYAWMGGEI